MNPLTPILKTNPKPLSNNQIMELTPKNALLKASTHKKCSRLIEILKRLIKNF
ncbi:hypothetical protein ACOWM0_06510 [Helicobacter pylori]